MIIISFNDKYCAAWKNITDRMNRKKIKKDYNYIKLCMCLDRDLREAKK